MLLDAFKFVFELLFVLALLCVNLRLLPPPPPPLADASDDFIFIDPELAVFVVAPNDDVAVAVVVVPFVLLLKVNAVILMWMLATICL